MIAQAETQTPAPRRVLVVDDSAFMRRMVSDVVSSSGEFQVVGTARDGDDALQKIRSLDPDIVTMDVHMPGMDGIDALARIMRELPRPVVMLSAAGTEHGVDATIRALELGAVDFVRKPSGPISLDLGRVRERLLDALRAAASAGRENSALALAIAAHDATDLSRRVTQSYKCPEVRQATRIVCIATSTGGPAALTRVIPELRTSSEVAIVVVQHMPRTFTRSLAHRLDGLSRLPVLEVEHDMPLLGGHVYIAQGGCHATLQREAGRTSFQLNDGPSIWGVKPAADPLFVSAAKLFRSNALGVVLTGMGRDGADGLKAIRDAGGGAIVQDRASSIIAGMPTAALETAGADHVVHLDDVADTIANMIGEGVLK